MSKSIISNDRVCLLCGSSVNLHKRHVFYGTANRKLSEEDGCWIWLCANHHNMTDYSVHFDHHLNRRIQRETQMIWEGRYGSREDFIKRYGRSYLGSD